jgi:hypothetical protein
MIRFKVWFGIQLSIEGKFKDMVGNGLARVVVMMIVLTMFVRAAVEANVLPDQHLIPSALPDSSSMFAKLHILCYANCVKDCGVECLEFVSHSVMTIDSKCYKRCLEGCVVKCIR